MRVLFFIFLLNSFTSSANTNSFILKLDEFTLAKSIEGLNDTIDVTKSAWRSSDSLHLSAYICGGNQMGRRASIKVRNENELLFQEDYDNQDLAYTYSFATSKINPNLIRYLSMTIGAAASENKLGWVYRMGIIRFV